MRWSPSACLPQLGLGAAVAVAVAVAVVVLAFVFVVVHHLGFRSFLSFPKDAWERVNNTNKIEKGKKRSFALALDC